MGTCSSKDSRKKKPEETNTPLVNKPNEINVEDGNKMNIIKEQPTILKSKNILNSIIGPSDYNYKLKDTLNNKEIEDTIPSKCKIYDLLEKNKLRTNGDFILVFDNNKEIRSDRINEKFDDLINEIFKDNKPNEIIISYSYKGLDIPEDIKKEYIDSNMIIGSAILDNQEIFVIITYERENSKITPYHYKRKENEELSKFNLFTAFCNANGCLYFSGGETEQSDPNNTVTKYNDFFYVDLTKLNDNPDKILINELPNLNEPRTWHSMIYVPNKYIFIVGGSNTKSVELYNMETNEITKDSELNEIRSECTLCLVNNIYLYAFYGFLINQEYIKTIERCNLLKEERKWEYVEYKNTNENNLYISFFGISYFSENEIILIGGNDNGDNNHYDYIYKIGENGEDDEIKEYDCNLMDTNNVFREKLFMPIDYDKSVNIPLIIGDDIKILILNTNTGKIDMQNYVNSFP